MILYLSLASSVSSHIIGVSVKLITMRLWNSFMISLVDAGVYYLAHCSLHDMFDDQSDTVETDNNYYY